MKALLALLITGFVFCSGVAYSAGGSDLPDLAIISIRTIPDPLISGQNYDLAIKIKNIGRGIVDKPFFIEVSGSTGQPRIYRVEKRIASGEVYEHIVNDIPSFVGTGSHQIKVRLDLSQDKSADDLVKESDENNNVATHDVSVETLRNAVISDIDKPEYAPVRGVLADKLSEGGSQEATGGDRLVGLMIFIVIIATIIGLFFVLYMRRLRHHEQSAGKNKPPPREDEMERLRKEMGEIKDMIKVTQAKYYKREIDEETFRALIVDHEKRLIQLETKFRSINSKK
ncbi:MAG: hypothetical protein JXB14_00300 [Candidatus Altiarchaeota archaeon]|nr:hypothetical protein [Candidatus Altiarchaeota archaeon]